MAYLDKCIERGVNYDKTVQEIRGLFRSSGRLDIQERVHALLTEFAEYTPGDVRYDHLEKSTRNAIEREKAVINHELGRYLKRVRHNGLQDLRRHENAADADEKQEAHTRLVAFSIGYGEFIGSIPPPKNGYAAKNRRDGFLIAYATAWKMTDVENRLAGIREAVRDVEKSDDCAALESRIEGVKRDMKQKQAGLKKEYFWTFIHPPSEWRLLNVFSTYAGLEEATAAITLVREELDRFDGKEGLYEKLQQTTDEVRQAREEIDKDKTTPSLDEGYIARLAAPKQVGVRQYSALKDGILKKFQRGYAALEDAVRLYTDTVAQGKRAVDLMTRDKTTELKKMSFAAAYDEKTRAVYRKALEDAEGLQQKRDLLGLKTLDDLAALKTTLARNVAEIEKHLDYEKRVDDLRKAGEAKLADVERAKDGLLALKEAELVTRTADIKKAEAAVAQREAELAGLNARITGVEQHRAQEEAQRLEAEAATQQRERELAAERHVREQTVGELTRTRGALSSTQETLRQQQEASATLVAQLKAEESLRIYDEQKAQQAEQQVAEAQERVRLAEERAQLMEQEAHRVAEETQRVAAEAEARTAAEHAASNAAQEHEENVFSPARAVVLGDGKISWL